MSGDKIYKDSKGKLHRDDGPAIEYSNGDRHWYTHGIRNRLDGPAIEHKDGTCEWYLNGALLSKAAFKALIHSVIIKPVTVDCWGYMNGDGTLMGFAWETREQARYWNEEATDGKVVKVTVTIRK